MLEIPISNGIINLLAVELNIKLPKILLGFAKCEMIFVLLIVHVISLVWNIRGSWYYTIYILKKNNYDGWCEDEPISSTAPLKEVSIIIN